MERDNTKGESTSARVAEGETVEITAKPERRKFTMEYKLRILNESDKCRNGELGALLRREGLYSSQLAIWRKEREAGLSPQKRGRKPQPLEAENKNLRLRLAQVERRLEQAEAILDAQKKLCQLYGVDPLPEVDEWISSRSPKS